MRMHSATLHKPYGKAGTMAAGLAASVGHATDNGANRCNEDFFGSVMHGSDASAAVIRIDALPIAT